MQGTRPCGDAERSVRLLGYHEATQYASRPAQKPLGGGTFEVPATQAVSLPLRTLSREVGRESDFTPQAITGLVDRASFLIENIEFFIQTVNPWLSIAYRPNAHDDPKIVLDGCVATLRQITDEMKNKSPLGEELCRLAANPDEDGATDRRTELRDRLRRDFKEFSERILEVGTKLTDLGARVAQEHASSANLVLLLTQWKYLLP